MGRQQQLEDIGVVDLEPGEYIDEIRFENDMIEFIFYFRLECKLIIMKTWQDSIVFHFFFFFFFKLIERLGLFFNLFDISYQPVSEDRLVEAWRDVGRQQQPEDVGVMDLGPG